MYKMLIFLLFQNSYRLGDIFRQDSNYGGSKEFSFCIFEFFGEVVFDVDSEGREKKGQGYADIEC